MIELSGAMRWLRNSSDCPKLCKPPVLSDASSLEYLVVFSHNNTTMIYLLGTGNRRSRLRLPT